MAPSEKIQKKPAAPDVPPKARTAARRRLETRWQESRETARALLDASPDSGLLMAPDGTVLAINAHALRALNTTREAIVGRCAYDFLPPEIAVSRRMKVEATLKTGRPARFEDVRFGRVIDNSIWPLLDAAGRIWRLAIFGRDITGQRRVETELQAKTHELQTILDALPQMVSYIDKDMVYRFVNRTYAHYFGFTPEEIVGRTAVDLVGPEACEATAPHVLRVLAGEHVEYEEIYPYPGHPPRHIHGCLVPDRSSDGGVCGYYAILNDVSELRLALGRIQASERETAALLKAARAILREQDFPATARTIFDLCREAIGARSGYVAMLSADGRENDVLFLESGGLPCDVDPLLPMPVRGLRAEAYRNGTPVYDNRFAESPWMAFMPEGHVRLENVLFAPIAVEGSAIGLIGIANKPGGFTEADAALSGAFAEMAAVAFRRIRDRRALTDSEERFRALVEASPAAVMVVQNGRYTYINPAGLRLLGLADAGTLQGRGALETIHPDHRPMILNRLGEIDAGRANPPLELKILTDDGRVRITESASVPVEIDGKPCALIISQDITARKEAEAALRESESRLRALSAGLIEAQERERRRIAAELHDELGQSLMVLKFQLRSVVQRLVSPDDVPAFEGIFSHINETVDAVRRVARELSPAVLENLGLGPAVQWLADQAAVHLGVQPDLHLDDTRGILTPAVETAVFRIIQEALTNAGKHAAADRVTIGVRKAPQALLVAVTDNGQGFAVHRTIAEKAGMGLAIMQQRAAMIGAALDIHSRPGEGTRISLRLPMTTAAGAKTAAGTG